MRPVLDEVGTDLVLAQLAGAYRASLAGCAHRAAGARLAYHCGRQMLTVLLSSWVQKPVLAAPHADAGVCMLAVLVIVQMTAAHTVNIAATFTLEERQRCAKRFRAMAEPIAAALANKGDFRCHGEVLTAVDCHGDSPGGRVIATLKGHNSQPQLGLSPPLGSPAVRPGAEAQKNSTTEPRLLQSGRPLAVVVNLMKRGQR